MFQAGLLDRPQRADRRIVDQHIQPPKARLGLGDCPLPVGFVCYIQFDEQGMSTDLIGHGPAGFAVDVGHHHASAFGGQKQGIGLADAAGGAGDQYHLVFNTLHAGAPCRGRSWVQSSSSSRQVKYQVPFLRAKRSW
ncbi:hypothetical protein D3C80_1556020 [compost metagenome]